MTEHDDERIVSRRYRALPHEEPGEYLDEAIRSRARAARGTVPAPLVPPTGRSRWYFPLAAAAILVLAVAVTWHVEREQPDAYVASAPELATPAPKAAEAPAPAPRDAMGERRKLEKPSGPARDPAMPAREAQPTPRAEAPAAPAASAEKADAAASQPPTAATRMMRQEAAPPETPEQWLERIAKLRAEGRHDEADKALAEFRSRYPDFRIAPEMLQKVEKR
jgi:hypothetical protein